MINPVKKDNVKLYGVLYKSGASKYIYAIGATNAHYISRQMWPDNEIITIKEITDEDAIPKESQPLMSYAY